MRILMWSVVLALLAAAVALLARYNDSNIVIMIPPHRIDMSLNFFLLVMAGVILVFYRLGQLLQKVADFPERVRSYRERRAEAGSQRALGNAVQALLEGRFARAEKAATAAQVAGAGSSAGLAALIGARAAHRMQEFERREWWLERAGDDPHLAAARLVTSAECWVESRDNERALAALDQLNAAGGRHIHTMRLALTTHLQAGRWDDALKALRALEKRKALHPAVLARVKQIVYAGLLDDRRHDPAALEAFWLRIAPADRVDPELTLDAVRYLVGAGRQRAAAQAIEAALAASPDGADWDERLFDVYPRVLDQPGREQIEAAEAWLALQPGRAAVLRCIGQICLRAQLWGKARSYLEQSLRADAAGGSTGGDPRTLLALAELAERVGDPPEAARLFRAAARALDAQTRRVILPAAGSATDRIGLADIARGQAEGVGEGEAVV